MEGGESTEAPPFRRFALADEKDFDSLFFPTKKDLLALLTHFKDKSGRYAIKGSQHKLGG